MRDRRARLNAAGLVILIIAGAGCTDVRDFAGSWNGKILPHEAILEGFSADARVDELKLTEVDLPRAEGTLTTNDGRFSQTALEPIRKLSSDVLATFSFDGNPLRSYMFFAPLGNEPDPSAPALIVLSLFGDDHLELRIMRGNDLFGVFYLQR